MNIKALYKRNDLIKLNLLFSFLFLMTSDDAQNLTKSSNDQGIDALYSIDVYGNVDKLAYYYIYFNTGTPPQTQTLIIDSGSSITSFSCSDCVNCGHHISKRFDIEASTSSYWTPYSHEYCDRMFNETCGYEISYIENSKLAGKYFTDYIALGDDYAHSPVFKDKHIGCHNVETNEFKDQMVSGIIGIGYSSSRQYLSPLNSLLSQFEPENRLYSLCLANEGGSFLIGGYNHPSIPHVDITWVNARKSDRYKSKLKIAKFQDQILSDKEYITLFDSGTTHSYLPKPFYDAFFDLLNSILAIEHSDSDCRICYKSLYYEEMIYSFPTITLTFDENTTIEWKPISYLSKRGDIVEVGIGLEKSNRVTLGMTFLKYNMAVFDYRNERIGIGSVLCPNKVDTHTKDSLKLDWFKVDDSKNETAKEPEHGYEFTNLPQKKNQNNGSSYDSFLTWIKQYDKYFGAGLILLAGVLSISLIMIIIMKLFKGTRSMGYSTIHDQPDEVIELDFENELRNINTANMDIQNTV